MDRSGDFIIDEQIYKTPGVIVYRGRRCAEEYPVIIKEWCLRNISEDDLDRFKQEYELVINSNIEGIVNIYDIRCLQNNILVVMEDFEAVSLTQVCQDQTCLRQN